MNNRKQEKRIVISALINFKPIRMQLGTYAQMHTHAHAHTHSVNYVVGACGVRNTTRTRNASVRRYTRTYSIYANECVVLRKGAVGRCHLNYDVAECECAARHLASR